MTLSDLDEVLAIEQKLFPNDAWSEDLFLGELSQVPESRRLYVLVQEEKIIGYASLRFVGRQADINTIAISLENQGKGLGQQLLRHLESEAKSLGVNEMFLDVRADNLAATKLYEKSDFIRIDIRRNYYEHSIDAFVMRKRLV